MTDLAGKTVFITGSSRGIGAAIALRCAREGANVVVTGKTVEPHDRLPGTILSVAAECEAAGGRALPVRMDLRDTDQIQSAVDQTVKAFGGIDVVVNNGGAQTFTKTPETTPKQFDLIFGVNVRGTFFTTQACLPHLKKSDNPHILTMAAPLNPDPRWYADRLARTISKYGMSMCAVGWAEEFREQGIASNALWPHHVVATPALEVYNPDLVDGARRPEMMADAAHWIITRPSREVTGRFFLDDAALREAGLSDAELVAYWVTSGENARTSSFLEWDETAGGITPTANHG